MSHPDPTTLALAALGEAIGDDDRAHLDSCARCRSEMAELADVVALGREAGPELPAVPDAVWEGITAELGLAAAPDGADSAITAPGPLPTAGERAAEAPVADLAERRRRTGRGRFAGLLAVAAMGGAVVGGAVVWAAVDRSQPVAPSSTTVAQAVLEPLSPTVSRPGKATVVQTDDGDVVRVDARGLPAQDGFYEVWLLDAEATRLVALGALPSGSVGTFTVPPGVSIADFPVVDISLEPYDGDPGHSHDSLMRGTLEA